jgi:hypothetical protein
VSARPDSAMVLALADAARLLIAAALTAVAAARAG